MVEVIRLTKTISEGKLANLLSSLNSATVTEIVPKCRSSRSGLTLFCTGFDATLKTNKHEHKLYCTMTGFMTCSWYVDGEEIAVIQLPLDDPLLREITAIIETANKIDKVGEVDIPRVERERIVLKERPKVVWEITPSI